MHRKYEQIREMLEDYREELNASVKRSSSDTSGSSRWPPEVGRAVAYLHRHLYDRNLTVAGMEEQCRINGKSFAAKFRLQVGLAPKKYIITHRLEAAKVLLANPDLQEIPATQIALAVGFNSYSAFLQIFKKITGTSPVLWNKINSN